MWQCANNSSGAPAGSPRVGCDVSCTHSWARQPRCRILRFRNLAKIRNPAKIPVLLVRRKLEQPASQQPPLHPGRPIPPRRSPQTTLVRTRPAGSHIQREIPPRSGILPRPGRPPPRHDSRALVPCSWRLYCLRTSIVVMVVIWWTMHIEATESITACDRCHCDTCESSV